MTAELARHIGHRCHLLDPRRLRCDDCTQTVQLPVSAASTSTSSSPIPGKDEPRCAAHPTEHANGCRTCAADAKGRTDDTPPVVHQATADVAARAAEARAALRPRAPEPVRQRAADPHRLAEARAELAAREPVPLPAPEGTTP